MPSLLFFSLVAVYLVGVFGILVADSFVGDPDERVSLEERLAMIRATTGRRHPPRTPPPFDQDATATPAPYYVRVTGRR